MTHIEIPIGQANHLTLVHFSRHLTAEEGKIVVEGIEFLAEVYKGAEVNLWWGFNDLMVGPRQNILASGVEFETNLIPEFQARLEAGLAKRGLPISRDYATWTPHITNPPTTLTPWTFAPHKGVVTLVQKPHRVDVPFPTVA